MGMSRRIACLGFGGALGAAAVFLPASAADASGTYNSTASAEVGTVTAAGVLLPVPDSAVTAQTGSGPQSTSVGFGMVEDELGSGSLRGAVETAAPDGANLLTASADASADGRSSACAAILSGDDCGSGGTGAATVSLSLADVPAITNLLSGVGGQSDASAAAESDGSGTGGASGAGSGALAGIKVVLSITGPEASCTAGPAGSGSGFSATQSLASVTADVQDNGKSILPGGPVQVHSGDVLSQLQVPALLRTALGGVDTLPSGILSMSMTPGSTSGSGGPVATASTGDLGLSVEGADVLDVATAQVTCGPDQPGQEYGDTSSPSGTTTSPSDTAAPSGAVLGGSVAEQPLGGGIQTDEGRSR